MSNLKTTIESDNYLYEVDPLCAPSTEYMDANMLKCYLHFVEAFKKADREWQEKEKTDPDLQYYSAYLHSMFIAMDGMPVAMVTTVDDVVQVFNVRQGDRIEEDK